MKDDFLTLLVNETFESKNEDNQIDQISLTYSFKRKCYILTNQSKTLEFPNNWSVFSGLNKNEVQRISVNDQVLIDIISTFLNKKISSLDIQKDNSGIKFLIKAHEQLRKTA